MLPEDSASRAPSGAPLSVGDDIAHLSPTLHRPHQIEMRDDPRPNPLHGFILRFLDRVRCEWCPDEIGPVTLTSMNL